MSHTPQTVPRRRSERGQGLVSYALILSLVAVIVLIALTLFGDTVRKQYCQAVGSLTGELPESCQEITVTCNVQSVNSSGVVMTATVNDTAGDNDIDNVKFFVDGALRQTELRVLYCLGGGDATCMRRAIGSGTHKITAVATDAEGNTGQCAATVNVP